MTPTQLKTWLLSHWARFIEKTETSPKRLLLRQRGLVWGGAALVLVGGVYFFASNADESKTTTSEKVHKQDVSKIETPLSGIDEREIWVNRVEKKTKAVQEEAAKVKEENQFLQKRIDVLEELFKSHGAGGKKESVIDNSELPKSTAQPSPQPFQAPSQIFPPPGSDLAQSMPIRSGTMEPMNYEGKAIRRGPKIAHIGGGKLAKVSLKMSDMYLPAGSYSKAVLASGVAASTATNAQGNPQPIMLRLVDDGNLPRYFKSRVRDAVLLGACYGDISSERVLCRLETMSWVEKDGTTVEKKVEGWVMGEDGRSGLRGEVVDRSSDVAREAFGAGLLSAVANFFKYEATSSVFPVTPFGQTNALSSKQALQGAAASGAGSALDKLADFSIKRAEQMQPVIMVASGRIVDVVFKAGVDLSPETEVAEMKVVGSNNQNISQEGLEN